MTNDPDERTPLLQSARRKDAGSSVPEASIVIRVGQSIAALRAGKYPSQAQFSHLLRSVLDSDLLKPDQGKTEGPISAEGRRLLLCIRGVLSSLKSLTDDKNGANELQQFLWHASQASVDFDATLQGPASELPAALPNTRELKQDTTACVYAVRTLLQLVLSNIVGAGQALLADSLYVLRQVMADSAEQVSDQVGAVADTLRPENSTLDKDQPDDNDVQVQVDSLKETLEDSKHAALTATALVGEIPQKIAEQSEDDIREAVITRFHAVLARIRSDPQAIKAVEILLDLALKYVKTAEDLGDAAKAAVQETTVDVDAKDVEDHASLALKSLKSFLNKLSGQETEEIPRTLEKVANDIRTNDPLLELMQDLDKYVRRLLTDNKYAMSNASRRDAQKLWDRIKEMRVVNPTWKQDTQTMFSQINAVLQGIQRDELLNHFSTSLFHLTAEVGVVAKKSVRIMLGDTSGLFWDLINIFLPRLFRLLSQFPVPRVEMVTKDIDFVCDDFVLSDLSLLPSMLRLAQASEVTITREGDIEAQRQPLALVDGSSKLYMRGVKFACQDISFWLKRKTAWIPYLREETGFVDFSLLDKGLEADIAFHLNDAVAFGPNERPHMATDKDCFFTIDKVDVKLTSIDLHVRRSYHPILYWFLRPFIKFGMRIGLSYVLSSVIKTKLEEFDKIAFRLKGVVDELRERGYGPIEAWTRALASPAPSIIQQSVQGAYTGGKSLLEGAELTTKGIIKTDEEEGYALGIGGSQLLPDKGGPTHEGPHGQYGSGSIGRIEAQVDQIATEGAQDVKKKAQTAGQSIANIAQDVRRLKYDSALLQDVVSEEQPDDFDQTTWQSRAFDM